MRADLHLRYVGSFSKDDSEIPLGDLADSLKTFERLSKRFGEIFRLQGDISVVAVPSREGSHIVDLIIQLSEVARYPITNPDHLIEFLKTSGSEYAKEGYQLFQDSHEWMNNFFRDRPFDAALIGHAFVGVFSWLAGRRSNRKEQDFPRRIANEIETTLKKNAFRGFVYPIINDTASTIQVSSDRNFSRSASINQNNFEDFLAEDAQILPELVEGTVVTLKGEITSLKGTHGDSFTFQTIIGGKQYNLDLFPDFPRTTKAYTKYYQEGVEIEARVARTSMFKKPKLHLRDIAYTQEPLQFE